jgi:hypothetical protein
MIIRNHLDMYRQEVQQAAAAAALNRKLEQ